ncbi:MAG: PIN domain-containing protein, partial [Chloroflexota bacterium]
NTVTTSGNPPTPPTPPTPPPTTLRYPQVVLDAAVWVSAAIPQEQQHTSSRQWIDQYLAASGVLVISEWFIVEVAAAIGRRVSPLHGQRAYMRVYSLSQITIVPMSRQLMQDSAATAAALRLRAVDAVYVALAQQLGLPVVSWDGEIAQRGGPRVLVFDPGNFPW